MGFTFIVMPMVLQKGCSVTFTREQNVLQMRFCSQYKFLYNKAFSQCFSAAVSYIPLFDFSE